MKSPTPLPGRFLSGIQTIGPICRCRNTELPGACRAVVRTPDYIYVFEFKLDGSAQDALRQIDEKGYLIPYIADGRKLIKVGVSFSAEERNLDQG